MNPLIKKEIRLLLPVWAAVMAMVMAMPWIFKHEDSVNEIIPMALFFGIVLVAVDSYGREFSLGTFSGLMSQPIERSRIWRVKLAVLSLACGSALLASLASWGLRMFIVHSGIQLNWQSDENMIHSNSAETTAVEVALTLIALVGGLWTSLLFRQVSAAFWVTFLAPLWLLLMGIYLLPTKITRFNDSAEIGICIYLIIGFWVAHKLFFKAQDVGWGNGAISLSKWFHFEGSQAKPASGRWRRPIFALFKKELHLQSMSFFCALVLFILHIGMIILRLSHQGHFEAYSVAGALSEFFWILWLIIPLVVSSTSIADERKLGVADAQSCLPSSRRHQFIVKLVSIFCIGILFGVVMPIAFEWIAARLGVENPMLKGMFVNTRSMEDLLRVGFLTVLISFGCGLAGLYASSLTKSFQHAVSLALVIIIAYCFSFQFLTDFRSLLGINFNPILNAFIFALVTLVGLIWLAYLNFKYFQERGRIWRRNVAGILCLLAFVYVASAGLYNRAWEYAMPAEPAHGAVRLTLAIPPKLNMGVYQNTLVYLPDGRVWYDQLVDTYIYDDISKYPQSLASLFSPLPESAGIQKFFEGSNWVSVAASRTIWKSDSKFWRFHPKVVKASFQAFGVKSDGSLHASAPSANGEFTGDKMEHIGVEVDWKKITFNHILPVVLRNDGTLWVWKHSISDCDETNTHRTIDVTQPMEQVGFENNWKDIEGTFWRRLFLKNDGSAWIVSINKTNQTYGFIAETNLNVFVPNLTSISYGFHEVAITKQDGSLWIKLHYYVGNTNVVTEFFQVGSETNWCNVASMNSELIGLKKDGSLWKWSHKASWQINDKNSAMAVQQMLQIPPVRVGIHNDWVAITSTWYGTLALSADGGLWLWPDREQYEDYTLLKLPKQPKHLANIFDEEKPSR